MSSCSAPEPPSSGPPPALLIPPPDDWHLHLRDGPALASLGKIPTPMARAIIMPNLKPPVTTTELALAYRQRVLDSGFGGLGFEPLMTLYLTDNMPPEEIDRASASGRVFAVKYYPAGATTNSDFGVTDIRNVIPTLRRMAEVGMPLLIHGEVTDPAVDIFDRERAFIEGELRTVLEQVATLKVRALAAGRWLRCGERASWPC